MASTKSDRRAAKRLAQARKSFRFATDRRTNKACVKRILQFTAVLDLGFDYSEGQA